MKNKLWKRAIQSVTWYKSSFSKVLISSRLFCVVDLCKMDPITLCAQGNLLIAYAIGSDLRKTPRTLYFCILGRYLTPRISLCFLTSVEVWVSKKLMSQLPLSPRALSTLPGRSHCMPSLVILLVINFRARY